MSEETGQIETAVQTVLTSPSPERRKFWEDAITDRIALTQKTMQITEKDLAIRINAKG